MGEKVYYYLATIDGKVVTDDDRVVRYWEKKNKIAKKEIEEKVGESLFWKECFTPFRSLRCIKI